MDDDKVITGDHDLRPEEERFKIVNTVRSRHNKVQRRQHPMHARLKQHLGAGQHRVLRGRPLIMTATQIKNHLKEIGEKARMGLIQVQTMDGRIIDPEIIRERPPVVADAPPPPAPVLLPHKPLDSAANDKNTNIGENMPQMPGGIPLSQLAAGPGNVTTGGIPGPLENEKGTPPVDPASDGDPAEEPHDPTEG